MAHNGTFHQHIIDKLRALIRDQKLQPGQRFLTEREIAERFETSRPTANKALSSLVSEGLLEVRRGAGTFVRERVLDYDLERLVSFTDKAKAAGKKPGTMLIEFHRLTGSEAPPGIAGQLRVGPDDAFFYMERIRLADGRPVIYERRHVVASLCPKLTRTDAKGSLYACWTSKCDLAITGAEETIHAVNASRTQAQHLQVRPGSACFQITAIGFTTENKPLWHEDTIYRADLYEFRNRIGGLSGTRAAMGRIME